MTAEVTKLKKQVKTLSDLNLKLKRDNLKLVKDRLLVYKKALSTATFQALPNNLFSMCGIYFLYDNSEVVYVGQSTNVIRRINEHTQEGVKTFNKIKYHPCCADKLDETEMFFINLIEPKYNIANKHFKNKDELLTAFIL